MGNTDDISLTISDAILPSDFFNKPFRLPLTSPLRVSKPLKSPSPNNAHRSGSLPAS